MAGFDFGDRRTPRVQVLGVGIGAVELIVKTPDNVERAYSAVYNPGVCKWQLPEPLELTQAGAWKCAWNVWKVGDNTKPIEVRRFSFEVGRSPFTTPFARPAP